MLMEIRPCVDQAIDLMEMIVDSRRVYKSIRCPSWRKVGPWLAEGVEKLEEDVMDLEYSPQKTVAIEQAKAVWNLAVVRRIPVVLFIRTRRPLAVVLLAICERAGVEARRVVNAELEELDFSRLTLVCSRLAHAPLKVCDARVPGVFLKTLPVLFSQEGESYAVCDWELEGDELVAAQQLSKESGIRFLCRNGAGWGKG